VSALRDHGSGYHSNILSLPHYPSESETRSCIARIQVPDTELPIVAVHPGWAEQAPEMWWDHAQTAIRAAVRLGNTPSGEIGAIGITYQMHGLVCLDREGNALRPSIIWCDSRAIETGNRLAGLLGTGYCHQHLLNSPGNFTASKLRWVMENEPACYRKIHHIMLPGDYISYRLTGVMNTTLSGL
jgi:xylulokinase